MRHRKILLIDDDPDDQFIFRDVLNEVATEIECITTNTSLEALNLLNTTLPIPSLIFLDLNMPVINGFECLSRIKKEKGLKEIPVIVFTTSDSAVDEKQAKELGAAIFFTKTPKFKLLKENILSILNIDFSKSQPFIRL